MLKAELPIDVWATSKYMNTILLNTILCRYFKSFDTILFLQTFGAWVLSFHFVATPNISFLILV